MKKTISGLAVLAALASSSVFAHSEGDFIVRLGMASVVPNDNSEYVGNTTSTVEVDTATQVAFTLGYMFTDNFSLELLGSNPFKHNVSTTERDAGEIGDFKHLPLTLMAQYYFGHPLSDYRPYVGVGLNYTIFFDAGFEGAGQEVFGYDNMELDNSFGLAANIGVDYMINENWFVNASAWYANMDTDISYKFRNLSYNTHVDVDPLIFMFSGGYKF